MDNKLPHLTFACELPTDQLSQLLADKDLIPILKALGARVSLGILDFSEQRVEVVRQLTQAGIPVIAWLLLPQEDGYWFNLDNAQKAATLYGRFKKWTLTNDLQWSAIGLDIEPDIRLIQGLRENHWDTIRRMMTGASKKTRRDQAIQDYRALVIQMRVDGYRIESYQFPVIVDERKAGSTILQRYAGIVDIAADLEVLMLYSSFTREAGPGVITEYGNDAQSIGIGSTGGGVDLEGVLDTTPLTWDELERDLHLACHFTRDIFIFSLEGCHQQGYLDRIRDMDWDSTFAIQPDRRTAIVRKGFQGMLWMLAHPWIWFVVIMLAVSLVTVRKHNQPAITVEPKHMIESKSQQYSRQKNEKTRDGSDRLAAKIKGQLIHAALEILSNMLTRATRKS